MAITLGKTYQDKISNFRGVATGHARYISGCSQVLLAPTVAADGSYKQGEWFDEQRCEEVKNVPTINLDNGATPGCDRAAPRR